MIKYRKHLKQILPNNPVVAEIGVAEGLFSSDIYHNWDPSKLYLIDLWESHPEFPGDAGFDQKWHNKNFKQVKERLGKYNNIEFLRGPSVAMSQYIPDNSLDLVYIDACHSYECVKNDINAYWPKLKTGGVMAFHDAENPDYGVNLAAREFAQKEGIEVFRIPEDKSEDAGVYFIKQ